MYNFQVVSNEVDPSELDTSLALRCQFEQSNLGRFTRACIVGDGYGPIVCGFPDPEKIIIQPQTRGWSSIKAEEDDHRIHYVWR